MWIEHIGELAIGFFILLIIAHFGLHFFFKYKKKKMDQESEK